jgi:hypothetical protein
LRLFRLAASLDLDQEEPERYDDFSAHETHDLLIRGKRPPRRTDLGNANPSSSTDFHSAFALARTFELTEPELKNPRPSS